MQILVAGLCLFAIKSGGHNANPTFNDINNGVSLDLGLLNTAALSLDRTSITLGAGTNMKQAYASIENEGIAFPAGICEGVGVGGLSTGGGESLF